MADARVRPAAPPETGRRGRAGRRERRARAAAVERAERRQAGGVGDARPTRAATWLVFALALAATAPVLGVGYVLDDHPLVERDARIVGTDLHAIWTKSYWGVPEKTSEYRPIVLSSYALERRLLGPSPFHFHLVDWLLHGLVSVLVLVAGRAIGLGEPAAFVGAALFAVHPIHLDAVAPIVGRAELFAALGFVGSAALWVAIRRAPRVRFGAVLALAALVALGAFSKETALAVVPLCAAIELLVVRPARPASRRTLLAASLAVATAVGLYLALRATALGALIPAAGSGSITHLENPLVGEPAATRIPTAATLLTTYLRLFLWPAHLSPDYSYDTLPIVRDWLAPATWAGVAFLVALAAASLAWLRARPALAVAAIAFAAPWSIVSNAAFPIGTMLAERLLYLPSVGLCWLVGIAVAAAAARWSDVPARTKWSRAALGVLVLALGAASVERADDWRNEKRLYWEASRLHPRNFLLWRNIGAIDLEAQRFPEALASLERVNEIAPDYAKAWGQRGFLHAALGDLETARQELERSVELEPRDVEMQKNLAAVYRELGRDTDADRVDARVAEIVRRNAER